MIFTLSCASLYLQIPNLADPGFRQPDFGVGLDVGFHHRTVFSDSIRFGRDAEKPPERLAQRRGRVVTHAVGDLRDGNVRIAQQPGGRFDPRAGDEFTERLPQQGRHDAVEMVWGECRQFG